MKFPGTAEREHTGDRQVDGIQRNRDDIARMLKLCPYLVGRAVAVRFVAFTAKVVTHKLGVPAAFFVIRHDFSGAGAGNLFAEDSSQTGVDMTCQLNILPGQSCDVVLWFYPRPNLVIDLNTGQSP